MKNRCPLFLVALLPLLGTAQTMQWLVPVDMEVPVNSFFNSTSMAVDDNGNAAVLGPTGTITFWNSRSLGDLAWRSYDASGQQIASIDIPAVASASDMVAHAGSYFVVGQYKDSLRFPGHPLLSTIGQLDPIGSYLCRIELNGTVTWVKDAQDLGLSSMQSIAAGPGQVLHLGAWDFLNSVVAKVDMGGVLLDSWPLQGVGVVSDITVNASGTVAIAGSCLSNSADLNGTVVTHAFSYTVYLARFNANGTLDAHVVVEDVTCPFPSVALDDIGNAYISGDANLSATIGPFTIPDAAWVYSEFLAKMDTGGTVTWLNVPMPGNPLGDAARAMGQDMVLSPAGGVWQGGFARGANEWGNGVSTSTTIPGQHLYFRRVDGSGNTQEMISGDGSSYAQTVHGLATDGANAVYMLGVNYDTLQLAGQTFPQQGYHFFLTRWDALGTGVDDTTTDQQLALFPNPATDRVTLDLSGFSGSVQVQVLDAVGRTVLRYVGAAGGPLQLDLADLPSARYFIRAVTKDHAVVGSLVKQ